MLAVRNVTKTYSRSKHTSYTAIKDVSFDIQKGDFVCIVGPSGSGKTTLLRCITGLETVYEGTITINGEDSATYLTNKRIALVSQQYSNFLWMTVQENIAIGFEGSNKSKKEIVEKTAVLLKRVGLYKVKDQYPSTLSGGMRQRIAIARAIAQDTDIIAFDEPFGALDVQTRAHMQEFLARLWEEECKTMILITHDIDEAIYLANTVIVLGTNPGTLKESVTINIKRPRKPEIRFQDSFVNMKKFISYVIRSESIKAHLEEGIMTDNAIFKMGLYIWSGNTLMYYAKDSGLFRDESLDVEQINFEDNKKKISLWKQGKLDAVNVTLAQAITLHEHMPDIQIVNVLNQSFGADALVAQSDITSISELNGKTIGLEKESGIEFFLLYILHKAGMSLRDVHVQDMQCSDIGSAIIGGTIDAGIVWEPWLEKVHELGNVNILKTTKDYPVLCDVLIATNDVIENKRDDIEAIKKVWSQSVKDWRKHKKDVINTASSHIGIPAGELSESLKKIKFFSTTPKHLNMLIEDIQDVLIKEHIISKKSPPDSLFGS